MTRDRWLVAVFLASLLLRLVYLQGWLHPLETRQTPLWADAAAHYLSAVVLTGGDVEEVVAARMHTQDFEWSRANTIARLGRYGPGYALFLAGLFTLFGEDPWPVRYVQALLGALSCAFVYLVGRELGSRRVGVVAGSLAAVHPTLILFTGRILTEGLATFYLWLGLFAMIRGLRLRRMSWLAGAGLALALAALTRPTLLAAVPLLAVAAALVPRCEARTRAVLVAVFAGAVFVPLAAWNVTIGKATAGSPIAGGEGIRYVTTVASRATNPLYRGWAPDGMSHRAWRDFDEDSATPEHPIRRLPAALNLVFYHLWYLDNIWREVPPWLHGAQRAIVVLGLAGIGASLLLWRTFAPLLALALAFAAVSVKWIEILPNLPLLPALFVFAGLFAAFVFERLGTGAERRRRLWGKKFGYTLSLLEGEAARRTCSSGSLHQSRKW